MNSNSASDREYEWEIAKLVKILDGPATSYEECLDYEQRLNPLKTLIKNDIGNQKSISALIVILEHPNVRCLLHYGWASVLLEIDINQNRRAIAAYLKFINNVYSLPYTALPAVMQYTK